MGPVQNATAATDVSTNGTLVTARSPWASTFTGPTVNGVTFAACAPPGWTNGAWTLLAGSSTGDAGYDVMLDSARATNEPVVMNPTDWGGLQLDTLGALTIGGHYEIQVWYSDQRRGTATNVLYDLVMTLHSATGTATPAGGIVTNLASLNVGSPSAGLDADPNNLAGPSDTISGSFVTGAFERTSTDSLWLIIQGTHPLASNTNVRSHTNGFQIREVASLDVGTNYCTAAPNSTGASAAMSGVGSATVAQNKLTLEAANLPLKAFGFFLTSSTQGFTQNLGGSQGNLCLSGAIGRYIGAGQIQNSGATGVIALALNSNQHPTPTGLVVVQAGQTWHFTAWYHDALGGSATSNFADGLEIASN